MQHYQNRYRINTKRKKKTPDASLKNVVSLRVTDHEKELLDKLSRATSRNVSDVVREALSVWLTTCNKLCLKP